uniref:Uncharacterized protein n=1 Tax=Salix viminalis TaxID=40686 RepID=A0A6N2MRX8_SALVM
MITKPIIHHRNKHHLRKTGGKTHLGGPEKITRRNTVPAKRDNEASCHAACIEVVQNPQHQVPTEKIQWVLTEGTTSFLFHILSFPFPFLSFRLHC